MRRTISFEKFIERSKSIHGNKYSYPEQEFKGILNKVKILCPEHGEFLQNGGNHMRGRGCKKCGIKSRVSKQKKSKEKFISDGIKKHGKKYDYSKVNYINNKSKVEIICKIHGSFFQIPNNHLKYGCSKCGNIKSGLSQIEDWGNVYEELVKVHGNRYEYDEKTYIRKSKKINVYCSEHDHHFEIQPTRLLRGQGCYYCGLKKISDFKRGKIDEVLKDFKKIHGNRYSYVKSSYTNNSSPIEILCKKHGSFYQIVWIHKNGHGCPKCSTEEVHERQRSNTEDFLKKCTIYHGNTYDYSKVNYIDNSTKIEIICKIHGSFFQSPNQHIGVNSQGCPTCRESSGERMVREYLKVNNINFEPQKSFKGLRGDKYLLKFDFYLPDYNLVIEYNGKQHYEPVEIFGGEKGFLKQVNRDKKKKEFCKKNNLRLLPIKYDEVVDEVLNRELKIQ